MDIHLGYEKNSVTGNNSGNSRNGKYPKMIQTEHGVHIPVDTRSAFPVISVQSPVSIQYRWQS